MHKLDAEMFQRSDGCGPLKRDLMTEFSKIEVPLSVTAMSRDKANIHEGGIFGANKADFYPSLQDQLEKPKMREALDQLGAHDKPTNRDAWTKSFEAASSTPNQSTSVQVLDSEPAYSQSTF